MSQVDGIGLSVGPPARGRRAMGLATMTRENRLKIKMVRCIVRLVAPLDGSMLLQWKAAILMSCGQSGRAECVVRVTKTTPCASLHGLPLLEWQANTHKVRRHIAADIIGPRLLLQNAASAYSGTNGRIRSAGMKRSRDHAAAACFPHHSAAGHVVPQCQPLLESQTTVSAGMLFA